MAVDPALWPRIKLEFERLQPLPHATREAAIAGLGLGTAVAAELRSLLAHHDRAGGDIGTGFLDEVAVPAPPLEPALGAAAGWPIGRRLGAWQIVRALGSGGMGDVFEVRRVDGSFEGRAAVKRLRTGLTGRAVLQRFAHERRTLARLAHPHIARLLDAGADAEGQPYFVMEYVDGRPLHEAAAGRPLEARLGLFLQLAEAVAHAHRHLLVHRDLKPGNVLVDAEGQVKLLDFGIAKALDPLEAADAALTAAGPRPFTPQYASPEQVRGEPVSTATDIYSLGVLLYQLLTGVRPTGQRATSAAEVAQAVLLEQPTRPSRLSEAEVLDPQWWQTRRRLEGDLDNILLKALQKAPEQRYASVEALAADVRAFLEGRPVGARGAGPWYVAAKFVRRHRVAVLAVALGGVGLVTGLVAALAQARWLGALGAAGAVVAAAGLALALLLARRAATARRTAEGHVAALRRLSRELVAGYGELVTALPGGQQRKAALLLSTAGYLETLLQQTPGDSGLQAELGLLLARLAHLHSGGEFAARPDHAAVLRHGSRALELCAAAEQAGTATPALAEAWGLLLGDLARVAQDAAELDEARRRLDEAEGVLQRARRRWPGDLSLRLAEAAIGMLHVQWLAGWDRPSRGDLDAGLQALERLRGLYGEALCAAQAAGAATAAVRFQIGTVASTQALMLVRQQQLARAHAAATEAVAWREQALAEEPHNRTMAGGVAADRNLLAGLCLDLGDPVSALHTSSQGWLALERLIAEDPGQQTWLSHRRYLAFHHGRALLATGQARQALAVLAVSDDWLTPLQADAACTPRLRLRWARTRLSLAQAQRALGRPAGPLLDEVVQALERHLETTDDAEGRQTLADCRAARAPA
jgi:hypothetical protein